MWKQLICPWKYSSFPLVFKWSKRLESVRKDVECCFGRLKGRFRILKLPCRFQSKERVDNCWFAACTLHNMVLTHDGLDSRWEAGVHYDKEDGKFGGDEAGELDALRRKNPGMLGVAYSGDNSSRGCSLQNLDVTKIHDDGEHFPRKQRLVEHFTIARARNEVVWF